MIIILVDNGANFSLGSIYVIRGPANICVINNHSRLCIGFGWDLLARKMLCK